jgi:uncharacterized protein YkwD
MNRNTLKSLTFSVLLLVSGASIISTNARTSANTLVADGQPSRTVVRVAQSNNVDTTTIEQSIINKINQYRASRGLSVLSRNISIDSQSKKHSQEMAKGKAPFGHDGFKERVQATGLAYSGGAAENVAFNMGFGDPATKAVEGWLKSPQHRQNIEGKYDETGIGVAVNNKGEVFFTQIFISSSQQ